MSIYLHPLRQGILAQLVEQRTENPCVPGSIPGDTTKKFPKLQCLRDFLFYKSFLINYHYILFEYCNLNNFKDAFFR